MQQEGDGNKCQADVTDSTDPSNKKYNWDDVAVRRDYWARNGESYMHTSPWLLWNEERAVMLCKICVEEAERLKKINQRPLVNTFTTGSKRILQQAVLEHELNTSHRKLTERVVARHEWDAAHVASLQAGGDSVLPLFRIAYGIGYHMKPFTDYPQQVATHILNGCPGLKKGGPYQSERTCKEMLGMYSMELDEELVKKLSSSPVVCILVDESTDRSTMNHMAVYVSYIQDHRAQVSFLQLEHLLKGATADHLLHALCDALNDAHIDVKKVIGLATDGASVMTGAHAGLWSKVREMQPCLVGYHCIIAHRLQLACSDLFSSNAVCVEYDKLLSSLNAWFSLSAQRKAQFRELQAVLEVDPLTILRLHKVRWFSRARCVSRLQEVYVPLCKYFLQGSNDMSATPAHRAEAGAIFHKLTSFRIIVLTRFLSDVLDVVAKLSALFQSVEFHFAQLKGTLRSARTALNAKYVAKPMDAQDIASDLSYLQMPLGLGVRDVLKQLSEGSGQ